MQYEHKTYLMSYANLNPPVRMCRRYHQSKEFFLQADFALQRAIHSAASTAFGGFADVGGGGVSGTGVGSGADASAGGGAAGAFFVGALSSGFFWLKYRPGDMTHGGVFFVWK